MRTKILFLICLLMAAQSVASKDFNLYDNRGQVVIDIDTIIAPVVCSATKMLSDDIESLDSKLHVGTNLISLPESAPVSRILRSSGSLWQRMAYST